jgi:hypothetical protein
MHFGGREHIQTLPMTTMIEFLCILEAIVIRRFAPSSTYGGWAMFTMPTMSLEKQRNVVSMPIVTNIKAKTTRVSFIVSFSVVRLLFFFGG